MNGYEEWRAAVDWSYQHVFITRLSWSSSKPLYEEDGVRSTVSSSLRTSAVTKNYYRIFPLSDLAILCFTLIFYIYINSVCKWGWTTNRIY